MQFIGLCHGVQTTLDLIAGYVDVPKDEIDFLCAGINHMAWFLSLRDKRDGRDLYPILRENFEKPEYYINEKVRGEVMRHFGYFMTESTGPSVRVRAVVPQEPEGAGPLLRSARFRRGVRGVLQLLQRCSRRSSKSVDYLATESKKLAPRSVEYCSYILEAAETGKIFRLNGNVRNDGYITNLPQGCCVEVPIFVDARGLHPTRVGDLPPQCAALNQSNVTVQGLAVEAALTGDPELAMQAVALDPLTSAVCTLKEVARDDARDARGRERSGCRSSKARSCRPSP